MIITCDNKGCYKQSESKLNKDDMLVYCAECQKPIKSVTENMKRVLSSLGQIIRVEMRKPFMLACMECRASRPVVLNEDDKPVCSICDNEIEIHPAMLMALKETGIKRKKSVYNKDDGGDKEPAQTKKKTRNKKGKNGE